MAAAAVAPDHSAAQHIPASPTQDGLEALIASADPDDQKLARMLIGEVARGADATVAGAADTKRLADDPTPRRTLSWTQWSFAAVVLTLLTTVAVPIVQAHGDGAKEAAHQQEVKEQHQDELRREDALIEILRAVTKKQVATTVPKPASSKAFAARKTSKAITGHPPMKALPPR